MVARPPINISDLEEETKGKKRVKKTEAVRGSLSYIGNGKPLPESFNKEDESKKETSTEIPKKTGSLTYSDIKGKTEKVSSRISKEEKNSKVKSLLLPIVVAVALSAIMLVQFAPTKVDLYRVDNKVIAISKSIDGVSSALQVERGRIDNIINSQGKYITRQEYQELLEKVKLLESK